MKILMITSGLDKRFGGPPAAVTGIACGLAEQGIDMSLAIFGQTLRSWRESHFRKIIESKSINYTFFPSRRTSKYGGNVRIKNFRILWKIIKDSDVITLHQLYNFQNVLAFILIKILHKKFVLMPHGTLTMYQKKQRIFRKFFFSPIFTLGIVNSANKIFVASDIEKAELSPKWQMKTEVVGLGINAETALQKIDNKDSKEFTFIYVGRLTHKKRIDLTIQALEHASLSSLKKIKLVICGSGDETIVSQIFHLKSNMMNLEIQYKGWLIGEQKIEELRNADCFILTSEDENFAISVAEALNIGLPCLISSKVALSTIVSKYQAGRVFNALDFLVIGNEALKIMNSNLIQLSQNALLASKELTWEKVSRKWIEELTQLQ